MSTLQNLRREGNVNPAQRGGQASGPGLFGLPGNGSFGRRRTTVRFDHIPAAPRPAQAVRGDDQPRRVGGLSCGQRRAVLRARIGTGAANFFAQASVAPATARPVLSFEELMAKYRRPAKIAQDDTADTPKTTPAMIEQAAARDMREAFPHHHDDEEADLARRCAGAGYVEAILAGEGC